MNTLPECLPECPKPGHGYMTLRPIERQTPEQRWCGVWYDCARCTSGTLYPSRELLAHIENLQSRKHPAPSNAHAHLRERSAAK